MIMDTVENLTALYHNKIIQEDTDDSRIAEFLTNMNIVIELNYARLLSMKPEALSVWTNCW